MLESIEKLRGYAPNHPELYAVCNAAADAIEAEIAERYMELPVDADGVPIHEDDAIQFVNEQGGTGAKVEVCAISKHYAYYGEGKHFYKASMCRHVKPRTVEDVLEEFAHKAVRIGMVGGVPSDAEIYADKDAIAEYAAEIRELMDGDAE